MQDQLIIRRVDQTGLYKHIETLTPSQKKFGTLLVDWIHHPRKLAVIMSGGPGTGKTYTARGLLNYLHVPILPMAYTARIAQNIGGRTIHSCLQLAWGDDSFLKELEKRLSDMDTDTGIHESKELVQRIYCKENPLVVMIDEIAMIPYYLSYWIIRYFLDRSKTQPVLVVGMGDGHQLHPVGSNHNLFAIIDLLKSEYETHTIELKESKRFRPDYEPLIANLRSFVDTNDDEGMMDYLSSAFPVVPDIDADILKQCTRALAFKNATVDQYNAYYVRRMLPGRIVRLYRLDAKEKKLIRDHFMDLKPGSRVFVTQNGCSDVFNGTSLVFQKYCSSKDVVECLNPVDENAVVVIRRNQSGIFPIVPGFASTVHKFQGETIDDSAIAINFDGSRDLNLVYTALSRVRSVYQIKAIQL